MKKIRNFLIASLAMVSMAAVSVSCGDDDEDENNTPGNESSDPSNPSNNAPSNNGNDNQAFHEYVDLGLPSGTLWATYNIGATKPEEYGDYFAWGETAPKEVYDWSTYKYAKAKWIESDEYWNVDSFTKYNSKDTLTTLLPDDDAATANWGSDWRMPTIEEQQALIDNCQYEWTEVNGVSGAKFTASNGNSIFLPAAGSRYGSGVRNVGNYGDYWSSSLGEYYEYDARYLSFGEGGAGWCDYGRRDFGFPVRAVRAKK